MANEWNVSYPLDHTLISAIPGEIRKLKTSVKAQLDLEHETPVDGDATGSEHDNGSAVAYVGSDTPANRPGGAALADNDIDDGRLWLDDTASPGTLKRWKDDAFEHVIASPLSAYTNEDSEGNAMLKAHAYLAATDGFVAVHVDGTGSKILSGYVGSTNDPVGAGGIIQRVQDGTGTQYTCFSFLVAKGEYFEIIYTGDANPSIRWKSYGTLSKPVDNN